jgi:hypothetical protein
MRTMKSYYRVMLGKKSAFADEARKGNLIFPSTFAAAKLPKAIVDGVILVVLQWCKRRSKNPSMKRPIRLSVAPE